MKLTKIIYALAWFVPATLVTLYLTGIIKQPAMQISPALAYRLDIATVALSLLTAYLAIKAFAFPAIKKKLSALTPEKSEQMFNILSQARILCVLTVMTADMAVFYFTGSNSPLYLAAILAVALIFCWPQKDK